ncbi:MAG TPA: TAXI family TRAP transporter solute-binding subunit, partial [bacterium]|nr:TAXI family TRAP transporter solute-binding subunit [bacterium]
GQDEDVPTIGLLTTIICNADLSDDFVYEVTKIIYESGYQKDTYASSEAAGWPKVCNIEEIVDATSIPLHPGAQKYFEEKGITF